jgi:hypothetical protein
MYKLVCSDLEVKNIYVGHTTNFKNRKFSHKSASHNEKGKQYDSKVYKHIRENGGFKNWSMIEIEKFKCNDVNEARTRERMWIETLNATLNCYIPSRTQPEWFDENKELVATYQKNYRLENAEHLNERFSCDCGGWCVLKNKSEHFKTKQHLAYIENPELAILKTQRTPSEIEQQRKESDAISKRKYKIANRERLKEKCSCPCGGTYNHTNKYIHLKTQKHRAYLENTQSPSLAI